MADADGVAAGEGDEVVRVEVQLAEGVEEVGDVECGARKGAEDVVPGREAQPVAPADRNLVFWATGLKLA